MFSISRTTIDHLINSGIVLAFGLALLLSLPVKGVASDIDAPAGAEGHATAGELDPRIVELVNDGLSAYENEKFKGGLRSV